jgi:hypothetical protein
MELRKRYSNRGNSSFVLRLQSKAAKALKRRRKNEREREARKTKEYSVYAQYTFSI